MIKLLPKTGRSDLDRVVAPPSSGLTAGLFQAEGVILGSAEQVFQSKLLNKSADFLLDEVWELFCNSLH